LQIDPGNMVAADRYVFAAFLTRNRTELEDAVRVAGVVLRDNPEAAGVRMDRGLCLQLLRQYAGAERDFERVGKDRWDVQALALAASDAARTSDAAKAKRLLHLAERIDPKYTPVRVALARYH
jgi:tetratricopeptide (TPR) repeat protein